jgi:hypothetical protein
MNDKNSATIIFVAVIGAIGVILAACIGLIPTLLPIVRPTATVPVPVVTDTLTSTPTPIPDTATVTLTPSEVPTLTATLEPLPTDTPLTETATITVTSIPPASDMEAYEGTWVNVSKDPSSDRVRLVITRIEVEQTGDATANLSICRAAQSDQRYVLPKPATATIYVFGLGAADFVIPSLPDLKWAILVQRTENQLVATVQEYGANNLLLNSDIFLLEKASLLDLGSLIPCQDPAVTQ